MLGQDFVKVSKCQGKGRSVLGESKANLKSERNLGRGQWYACAVSGFRQMGSHRRGIEAKKQPVAWPPDPIAKDEGREWDGVRKEPDTQSDPNQERNHIG